MAKLKDTIIYGDLTVTGEFTGSSQATTPDNADTLDGYHASSFVLVGTDNDMGGGTLSNVVVKNWYEVKQNLGTISGSATIDTSNGNVVVATLGAASNITFSTSVGTNVAIGFVLVLTNGGAYTITWNSTIKWSSGAAPTLSTSGIDILSFTSFDGGATWLGVLSGKGFA